MIIRVRHGAHYTVVRNKTVRDSRLSFKARGILVYLLSLPDDTQVNREMLADVGTDGERAIRTGLAELVKAGYIEHVLVQDGYGRWRTETTVRERSPSDPPTVRFPPSGRRRPTVENSPPVRSTKEKNAARASAFIPVDGPCSVCCEPATTKRDGAWLCPRHFPLEAV